MSVFDSATIDAMKSILKDCKKIELLYFEQENGQLNEYFNDLLTEISKANSNITFKKYSSQSDFDKYNIDKVPTLQVNGKNLGIIRYCGLPSGHEFGPFLEALVDISVGKTTITAENKELLSSLKSTANIEVFTMPTCPYCPQMVRLSHDLAMNSKNVVSEMIDAQEFVDLAKKYEIFTVPHTIINNTKHISGRCDQDALISNLKEMQLL